MLDLQNKSLSQFLLLKIIDSIVYSSSINKNPRYHLEISCSCCILIFLLNIYYALFPPSNFQNLLCRNIVSSLKEVSEIHWSPFFAEICNLYNISFLQELDLTICRFELGTSVFFFTHQKISGGNDFIFISLKVHRRYDINVRFGTCDVVKMLLWAFSR